jgi:hypothetical protein
MDLDFAFLADAADVASSKLYVLGGAFDTIYVPGFPATHPVLAVVMRLLMWPADVDRKHKLDVVLADTDGHTIATASTELMVSKSPDLPPGWKQPFTFPLRFLNTPFNKEGHYSIEIHFNANIVKTIPLRVLQAPQQK